MRRILLLALLISAMAAAPLHAQIGTGKTLGESPAVIPGVKLQVVDLVRLDATHLLVAVRINAGPGAPPHTLIADLPPKPANGVGTGNGSPPRPYTFATAKLIDESTKTQFNAYETVPAQPSFGPNSLYTTLEPGNWIQLGVEFSVPPPSPPNPDGTIPIQKVTFVLPKAKRPIKHIAIPLPSPAPAGSPGKTQ
jgi:hypothetical protein